MEEEKVVSKKLTKKAVKFSRIKRRLLKHLWLVRGGLAALILLTVYLLYLLISLIFGGLGVNRYTRFVSDFIFTPMQKIQVSGNRTNILILGKGGIGHETPDLTDTVIFASISHANPSVTLVSLPRDTWIPKLRAKLNSAYYWGNQKQEEGGLILAKSTVEEIVGEPVHYGVVINFSGFTKIIDILDGIEVDVERTFIDKKYPIPGKENDDCNGDPEYLCRYETISFRKGKQTMDGETALKFARSRNAEGDEGTDFARAARQQKILDAIQKKFLSSETFISPKKILGTWRVIRDFTETDIDVSAGAILTRRVFQGNKQIESYVLGEEFLINPPISPEFDSLYVFIPKNKNWNKVHQWIESILP